MTIKISLSTAVYHWSQNASDLKIPESVKKSLAFSSHSNGSRPEVREDQIFTVNQAWSKMSEHALDTVLNGSRDSDRLARATTQRARIPIPRLELLADFPYGTISTPQAEKKMVTLLRDSSERTLQYMSKISSPDLQATEEDLLKMHDFNTVKETYKTMCDLLEIDRVSTRPLIRALVDISTKNYLSEKY